MTPTIIIISAILVLTLLHIFLSRRSTTRARIEPSPEQSPWQDDSGAGLTAPTITLAATSSESQIEEESEPNWKDEPDFEVEMASPPEPRYRSTADQEPELEEVEELEELEELEEIEPEPEAEPELAVKPALQPERAPEAQLDSEIEIAPEPQPQSEPEFKVIPESRPLQPEPLAAAQVEPELEPELEPIASLPQPSPQPLEEPLASGFVIESPEPAPPQSTAPAPAIDFTGPRLHTEASSDPAEPLSLDEVASVIEKLPPLPQSVHQILKELESAVSSAHLVGDILSSDSTIGAALVRVVNSAALGVARRILTVHEAVSYLGFSTVRGIILRLKLAGLFPPPKARRQCYDTAELWVHATATSAVADVLAKRVNQHPELHIDPALASTLGLLHDIGRLAINSQFPARVAELRPQKKPRNAAKDANYENLLARERRILGADHAVIGGLLAERWQLPGDLAEGIRLHHLPAGQTLDNLAPPLYRAVVLVHIANQLVKLKHAYCQDMPFDVIPESLLTALNLPPSLDDLLDQSVCTAIAQATAISHELSVLPKPRKRLSA
jgi:HD-like signal output (HDOD) protein